jgi:hypothetical protein
MTKRDVALAQGLYFTVTGAWPLVHMPSFEAVTGPKVERWLVRTVGMLIGIVGGVLVSAAVRDRVTAEIEALAVGSATGLAAVDAVYAGKGRIAPIYLADAGLEAGIIAAWGIAHRAASRAPEARTPGSRKGA